MRKPNSPLTPLFRLLIDTQLNVGIMNRSTDVHEIPLTLEFPPFGFRGVGGELSEGLVGFFVLENWKVC
jgi:hypothetical protein